MQECRSKRVDIIDTHTEELAWEAAGSTWSAFTQSAWLLEPSHGLHFAADTSTRNSYVFLIMLLTIYVSVPIYMSMSETCQQKLSPPTLSTT